jgi:arginyl-tRNA synthetase
MQYNSLEENCGISSQEVKEFVESEVNPFHVESIRNSPEAMALIFCLSRFDDALLSSLESLDPVFVTRYLFLLKQNVSKALLVLPVKKESDRRKAMTHLCLFSSSRVILSKGLQILGLKPLRTM